MTASTHNNTTTVPTEASHHDLHALVLKLGDLVLDQNQMGILAMKNIGEPLIVCPLLRFIHQLNDEIFIVYEQMHEMTQVAKGGA